MSMKVLHIDAFCPEPQLIQEAAEIALQGVPIILPTDTVYGIGVAVLESSSPEGIYAIKQRDLDKAIPWLVADSQALELYGKDLPSYARDLAQRHWPGALTLIVRASDKVPPAFRAEDGSIALRAPACPVALALISEMGVPLATSSANLQGNEPAQSFETLDGELKRRVGLVIDGGECPAKLASTIVSCMDEAPRMLREGPVALESLLP